MRDQLRAVKKYKTNFELKLARTENDCFGVVAEHVHKLKARSSALTLEVIFLEATAKKVAADDEGEFMDCLWIVLSQLLCPLRDLDKKCSRLRSGVRCFYHTRVGKLCSQMVEVFLQDSLRMQYTIEWVARSVLNGNYDRITLLQQEILIKPAQAAVVEVVSICVGAEKSWQYSDVAKLEAVRILADSLVGSLFIVVIVEESNNSNSLGNAEISQYIDFLIVN